MNKTVEKEQPESKGSQSDELSPELTRILEDVSLEGEIEVAIDAAGEEGIKISPEEAKKILQLPRKPDKID